MKFLYRYWDSSQFPSPYTIVILMQFPLLFLMILSRIIKISVFILSNQYHLKLQLVYHHALLLCYFSSPRYIFHFLYSKITIQFVCIKQSCAFFR